MSTPLSEIPGVGAPARRALELEGHSTLESLDGADHARLLALHGVGRRGLERLQTALEQRGMSLGGDVPEPEDRSAAVTSGHTGRNVADLSTHATDQSPEDFVAGLSPQRRVDDGHALLALFGEATGEQAVMWGPSMIGYGQVHYRYDTGREGDTFQLGFSPRKAKISLYGLTDKPGSEEKLARLGKHTVGASCLYINKPEDVDLGVLEEMIREAWNSAPEGC